MKGKGKQVNRYGKGTFETEPEDIREPDNEEQCEETVDEGQPECDTRVDDADTEQGDMSECYDRIMVKFLTFIEHEFPDSNPPPDQDQVKAYVKERQEAIQRNKQLNLEYEQLEQENEFLEEKEKDMRSLVKQKRERMEKNKKSLENIAELLRGQNEVISHIAELRDRINQEMAEGQPKKMSLDIAKESKMIPDLRQAIKELEEAIKKRKLRVDFIRGTYRPDQAVPKKKEKGQETLPTPRLRLEPMNPVNESQHSQTARVEYNRKKADRVMLELRKLRDPQLSQEGGE